jgi:hypothetical protein
MAARGCGKRPGHNAPLKGVSRQDLGILAIAAGALSPSYEESRKMLSRPKDWQKIINAEAEVCHRIAPDGTRYPCTDEENAEVRRELLIIRTTSDKRRQQRIEER